VAEIKTKQHDRDVYEFINTFTDSIQKREDSFKLINIMQECSGYPPKMWGASIIGFGKYHYKSEKSKQEGDWPLIAFSPRKNAISLYVYTGDSEQVHLLKDLGKYSMSKACIYVKKLSDINIDVLKTLIHTTIGYLKDKYNK
jgi:hypothetical protein